DHFPSSTKLGSLREKSAHPESARDESARHAASLILFLLCSLLALDPVGLALAQQHERLLHALAGPSEGVAYREDFLLHPAESKSLRFSGFRTRKQNAAERRSRRTSADQNATGRSPLGHDTNADEKETSLDRRELRDYRSVHRKDETGIDQTALSCP
ncbi:hypothetical protein PENTCL1PPCAC_4473, partial [Pristionchus entomophagus]